MHLLPLWPGRGGGGGDSIIHVDCRTLLLSPLFRSGHMASWFLFSEWVSPIQQGSKSLALLIYTTGALLGRPRRRGQAGSPARSRRTGNLQAQAPGGRGEEKRASRCRCELLLLRSPSLPHSPVVKSPLIAGKSSLALVLPIFSLPMENI